MTRRDVVRVCLVTLGITLPVCAAAGALLGLYGKRLGLTAPVRTGILTAIVIITSQLAAQSARRRAMAASDSTHGGRTP
jgi:hypothetical protein